VSAWCRAEAYMRLDDRGVDGQLKRQAKLLAHVPYLEQRVNQFDLEDSSHVSRVFLEWSHDDYIICLPLVSRRHWGIN
jgi:hypothetical protein